MKFVVMILLALGLTGCSHMGNSGVEQVTPTPKLVGENTEVKVGKAGDQLVGNYRVYNKESYQNALAEGKEVVLFFYANWCPTCKIQEPINVNVFRRLASNENIAGFRVNFNDGETTPDGEELATEFGVSYQHTFVVLGGDGKVKKQLNGEWKEEEMFGFLDSGGSDLSI